MLVLIFFFQAYDNVLLWQKIINIAVIRYNATIDLTEGWTGDPPSPKTRQGFNADIILHSFPKRSCIIYFFSSLNVFVCTYTDVK